MELRKLQVNHRYLNIEFENIIQLSTKCTNKGPLGRGVSRGLRTRVSVSSKKDPIYGVSSEKGRLLFRE